MGVFDPATGLFQMRQEVGSVSAPLPRAFQPCQDEWLHAKLPLSVFLSAVSRQTVSIFNRRSWVSLYRNFESQLSPPLSLRRAWCQREGRHTPPFNCSHQNNNGEYQYKCYLHYLMLVFNYTFVFPFSPSVKGGGW